MLASVLKMQNYMLNMDLNSRDNEYYKSKYIDTHIQN
jgi:hypothetical protein